MFLLQHIKLFYSLIWRPIIFSVHAMIVHWNYYKPFLNTFRVPSFTARNLQAYKERVFILSVFSPVILSEIFASFFSLNQSTWKTKNKKIFIQNYLPVMEGRVREKSRCGRILRVFTRKHVRDLWKFSNLFQVNVTIYLLLYKNKFSSQMR